MRVTKSDPVTRALISGVVAAAGILLLVLGATRESDSGSGWDRFLWPSIAIFIAWRFYRLGLYTSEQGVRICNPLLTWWYPWHRIDRFEPAPTGEMFARGATTVALVTTEARRRQAFGLSTSGIPFSLSAELQLLILEDLNRLVAAHAKR